MFITQVLKDVHFLGRALYRTVQYKIYDHFLVYYAFVFEYSECQCSDRKKKRLLGAIV